MHGACFRRSCQSLSGTDAELLDELGPYVPRFASASAASPRPSSLALIMRAPPSSTCGSA